MNWIGRLLTSASQFGDSVRSGPDNTDRAFLNQFLGKIGTEVPMAKWLRSAKNKIKLHSAIGKTDHAGEKHGLSRYGTGLMEFEQEFQQGIRRGAGQGGMWRRMKV